MKADSSRRLALPPARPRWLAVWQHPGRVRQNSLRRVIAGLLLFAALLQWAWSKREHPHVVALATDVEAGQILSATDVELRSVPAALIPPGTITDLSDPLLEDAIMVASARAGELLNQSRILPATASTAGIVRDSTAESSADPLHIVPVKLADPTMASTLHHGDTVSLISAASAQPFIGPSSGTDEGHASPSAQVIAAGAHVISAGNSRGDTDPAGLGGTARRSQHNSTILVALPADAAQSVAAASLQQPLAIVITGPRATGGND